MFNKEENRIQNQSHNPAESQLKVPPEVQAHSQAAAAAAGPRAVDEVKLQMLMSQVKDNQNLTMGALGGFGAAIAGAVVWAMITSLTGYQIGFMAIGVGFLVGFAVRKSGRGIDQVFGFVGAGLSLLGCLLGNILTACIVIAQEEGMGFMDVFSRLDIPIAFELLKVTFSPIDVLFYGLAVYYGYRYSFRQLTESELASIVRPA